MLINFIRTKKALFVAGFFLLFYSRMNGQLQSNTDSLELIYQLGKYIAKGKLRILRELAEKSTDPEKKLSYSNLLIEESQNSDSAFYLTGAFIQKGHAYRLKGDLSKALESYLQGAKFSVKEKQRGGLYITIADVYSIMRNHNNAVDYYQKALLVLKNDPDSTADDKHFQNIATAYYNLGDEYVKNEEWDSALVYTTQSQILSGHIKFEIGEAYSLGTLGIIYSKLGNDVQAESNLNKSINLLNHLNEYPAICEFLTSMSDIYFKKGDMRASMNYALKSFDLATKYGLKEQLSSANLNLSQLYEHAGDHRKSLAHYKGYITYRDSVNNIQSVQQIADLRTDFEVSKKQKEVDLLATRNKLRISERNGFVFASLLLAAILAASIYFYTQKAKRNKLIAAQKLQEAAINHQKELLQSVITSQEAERKRIGMDLHDEVGAALSTLRIKIDKNTGHDEAADEQAEVFKSDIDKIITNMRNISHSLSPRISGNFGFYDAVYELADNVNRSGKVNMLVKFDEEKLPQFANEQAPMAIYRVLSELINNTLKHAAAKNIWLLIDVADDLMTMNYRDDGIGVFQEQEAASKGMGMQNIESRLGIIGAHWKIGSPDPGGYTMNISVPLK